MSEVKASGQKRKRPNIAHNVYTSSRFVRSLKTLPLRYLLMVTTALANHSAARITITALANHSAAQSRHYTPLLVESENRGLGLSVRLLSLICHPDI